ncbi:hypothetical protein EV361DRAFT_936346 [Lentinula raphanica]|nr:hypothetical protein F5880DRAFT_1545349 [Lentinula raphanica]KAJ3966183.1 hypothetical protein EV361DRAFT_936346 [Lentinula raphanica]
MYYSKGSQNALQTNMPSKTATAVLDFTRIYTCLGKETIASLQAFHQCHGEAQRAQATYSSQPTTVDFSHYRSNLMNKATVDKAEKLFKDFKPVSYKHITVIQAFEAKVVSLHRTFCIRLNLR